LKEEIINRTPAPPYPHTHRPTIIFFELNLKAQKIIETCGYVDKTHSKTDNMKLTVSDEHEAL
jgi:hypothetical protein